MNTVSNQNQFAHPKPKSTAKTVFETLIITAIVCGIALLILGASAAPVEVTKNSSTTAADVSFAIASPDNITISGGGTGKSTSTEALDNLKTMQGGGITLSDDKATPIVFLAADVVSVPVEQALGVPTGFLDQLIGAATAKYGWTVALFAWIGALRVAFKPTMSWLHSVVDATPTDRDNAILAKVEASKAMKTFAWLLDLLTSIKVGPSKPIPPVVKALVLIPFLVAFTGCASGTLPKLARELAKDPATVGFSIQLVTPWGQQNISLARSGTNNPSTAGGGNASVNQKQQ